MALSPSPTTTIDGAPVYASPSRTGPRNAWMAIEFRTLSDGRRYGVEWFGGATRDVVARRCKGGPWTIIETAQHEWSATPAQKTLLWF